MKTKKVGLQKFTEFEKRLDELLKKETIELKDIEAFTDSEKNAVREKVYEKLKLYEGDNKKTLSFINKVNEIMPKYIQNQTWEFNHYHITKVISDFISTNGMMPDKNTIADGTGLSRQSIYNHLKDYATHPIFLEQAERFKFLSSRLLARVYKAAINGETKAAKLYFDIIGNNLNSHATKNTLIENQNNFIQINGTVLSQEKIKLLTADQLNAVESMVKAILSKAELLKSKQGSDD